MTDYQLTFALQGDLEGWAERNKTAYLNGVMQAALEEGREAQQLLRDDVLQAGLGQGVSNAWRLEIYPPYGLAWNPTVFLFSKAAPIVEAWARGQPIGAKDGGAMAIPIPGTPAYDMRVLKGEHRVEKIEQRFGPLQLVKTPRGAMLVAKARQTASGRFSALQVRKSKTGGEYVATKGVASVPMFWLVRQVTMERRLNWPVIGASLERSFQGRVETRLQQAFDGAAQGAGATVNLD